MKNIALAPVWARGIALVLALALATGPAGSVLAAEHSDTSSSSTPSTASSSPLAGTSKPENTASSTPLTAAVVTGGAAATAQTHNEVNAAVVQTASATPSATGNTTAVSVGAPSTLAASSTGNGDASSTSDAASSSPPSLSQGTTTITTQNIASTTATTTAHASTGTNGAQNADGNAFVATGDAYASADAINVINTNIIDSTGLLYFKNLFSSLGINLGDLDLSYFTSSSTPVCSAGLCDPLSLYAQNAATATNAVEATAQTGGNAASSTKGSSTIDTGNAYASGNAINIINSNFIRSNYLLIAMNDFGNLSGDIVLPDAAFFQKLLAHRAGTTGDLSLSASNDGTVANSTAAVAQTGNNAASSTASGSSLVSTGAALSSATSLNQVNANFVGGTTVFLLFRIWGNWTGTVRGLPAGMAWQQTPAGLEITNAEGAPVPGTALAPPGPLSVDATSTAVLTNRVRVYALTGNNQARAADGTSTIATGNAYASANSVNVVNTNLVGHNWIYAIFNIFGDMTGDIAFGQPDLWVGAAAQADNPTLPGTTVPFTFTVVNRGTATATDVRLTTSFLSHMLRFATGSSTATADTWDLGSLAPGQTREVTVSAVTGEVPQGGSVAVPVTAVVSSVEHDANPSDNADSLTIVVSNPIAPGSRGPSFSSDPKLSVLPQVGALSSTAPAVLSYAALVANNGGTAFDAVATDVIRNAKGAVVSRQSWNLGNLAYNDELRIAYKAAFASTTELGQYTNVMTVTGHMHYPDGLGSVPFAPVSATTTMTILPPLQAPVATVQAQSCAPYLTAYLTPGGANDPAQVRKLQSFLIGERLGNGALVTGAFDAATAAAVKRFQTKYAANVLEPWGYRKPTGDVYYTTELQINALACAGKGTFALTQAQREEIDATRTIIAQLRAQAALAEAAPAPVSSGGVSAGAVPVHTVSAKEPAASSPDLALPPGMEVGVSTTSPRASWFAGLTRTPSIVAASVANAYRALLSTFGMH